jgi:Tfp pilus assembly protein PilF
MKAFYKPIAILLAVLSYTTAQTGPHTAEIHDRLARAAAYLKANDPTSAAKEFNAVLALDPKNAEANANLGVITFLHGDYKNAAPYLRKALSVDPSLAKTELLLGICASKLGEPGAQPLLEKSLPRVKDKSLQMQGGMELAAIYYQHGDLDRAASAMRSLVDLDPDNIEILYMAQRVYSELADETLNKLALLAPGSARMQVVIAERLINEGDLRAATEHYRKALEMDPHLTSVHFELAEAILEAAPADAQAQSDAEKELETAVKLSGESAKTECLFARIALLRGDTAGAFARYNRAFALNPGDPEAQFGMGRMLATMEKPQEAAKYLRMAVQSDPLNENAHYRLAAVCKKLQLNDEAEKELRLFREIKDAKDRLESLYRQMHKKPPGQSDQTPDTDR